MTSDRNIQPDESQGLPARVSPGLMIRLEPGVYEWSLPEALLTASHRWYWIVLFCLVGAMLGWLVAIVWPSPAQATQELYVGLDVYQAAEDRNAAEYAGLPFGNLNDYKNWQMANLNSLIYMDSIMDETLERLRAQDLYWSGVSRSTLVGAARAYWRNAGKWRLAMQFRDPLRAAQAVSAWQDVVVERVHWAVSQARQALSLASQLRSVADARIQGMARLAQLIYTRDALASWQVRLSAEPANSPLDEADRQLIWLLVVEAGKDPSWQPVLQTFPAPQSPRQETLAWLASVLPLVEQQTAALQAQVSFLENEQNRLTAEYARAAHESLGLSAELEVDKITDALPQQEKLRPSGQMMLIGACLGFALWVVIWLVELSVAANRGIASAPGSSA